MTYCPRCGVEAAQAGAITIGPGPADVLVEYTCPNICGPFQLDSKLGDLTGGVRDNVLAHLRKAAEILEKALQGRMFR